ncbi:hypothetical protein AURDEDRAFT_162064 [Auricularia subglabra TFB-10046 SS5]|nr:hypothetical protein AURDEDRAFT_162064 [Auricularia subglabra TFB-10046 SS5]
MDSTTHPVFPYLEVRRGLRRAEAKESSWKVPQTQSEVIDELSAELSALRQKEACGEYRGELRDASILDSGAGEGEKDLGTIGKPDVDALRALAKPCAGTDADAAPSGHEVPAYRLRFDDSAAKIFKECAEDVGAALFPNRPIKLVLDKLMLYEPGALYARRREATRADNHRGTLLMGCGPEYEDKNGTIQLHHPGEGEGPGSAWPLGDCDWVAFTARLEHSMALVESAVRIVLRFDIYIEDESVNRLHTVACVPPQQEARDERDEEDTKFLTLPLCSPGQDFLDSLNPPLKPTTPTRIASEESLSKLVRKLITVVRPRPTDQTPRDESGQPAQKKSRTGAASKRARTVAFVLHHLYREQTLTPDILRGVDRALYNALRAAEPETKMKVDFHPVYVTVEEQFESYSEPGGWKTQIGLAEPETAALQVIASIPAPVVWVRRDHTEAALAFYQLPPNHRCEHTPEMFSWFAGAMFIYFS